MANDISSEYIRVFKMRFKDMKHTADKAMGQLSEDMLFWSPNGQSECIASIVKHMSENMVSRWTDFLHTDGEKKSRNRDSEIEPVITSRKELVEVWEKGWNVLLYSLHAIKKEHLLREILIRKEAQTLIEALERQMYHYSYHIGQIVYIANLLKGEAWNGLFEHSITSKRSI
ncbi:DUF1572 family protein [Peribacillus sp. NPDC097675]|uniref:DUF1572 family protein n=1 Tax=Peribacillus sp. NPDC097675 TaxID=3390618 RepID=UPI003CFCB94C